MLLLAALPAPLPSFFPCQQLQPAPPFLTLKENYFCSLAGLATNIPRDAELSLGCSLITCRGVAVRDLMQPVVETVPLTGTAAGADAKHRCSVCYLRRHPPPPQGRLLMLPGNQSLRPMVFTPTPTTAVCVITAVRVRLR